MYSKQEISFLTQQFWTTFGGYIAPVLSAEGERINWVNYKTGEKDIRFVMTADNHTATISIILSHKDASIQQQYFDKFLQLKNTLVQLTGEEWSWAPLTINQHGKTISEIAASLPEVNIFNKAG